MNTITVTASKSYQVLIGEGLLSEINAYIAQIAAPCKCAIISDSNVWPLYGQTVATSMISGGYEVVNYVFPAGEASKNSQTYLSILDFLADNEITRSDIILALGGGVVGDMAGFTAATFLRGIRYVQVPTTLLAMVDSSVGGKTAIDLPAGKNLVGAFYQPSLVVCDTAVLQTLPQSIFKDGCAEVIKYGVLFDAELFRSLEEHTLDFDKKAIVTRCVELKRDVVAKDEFDTGLRQKLNLGHTIGHSIEKQSNFSVSHGQAVAAGMAIISRSAAAMGICASETADRICSLISAFGLPVNTEYNAEQLLHTMLSDKKRSGQWISLIIPQTIGSCMIQKTPISDLQTILEAGL